MDHVAALMKLGTGLRARVVASLRGGAGKTAREIAAEAGTSVGCVLNTLARMRGEGSVLAASDGGPRATYRLDARGLRSRIAAARREVGEFASSLDLSRPRSRNTA